MDGLDELVDALLRRNQCVLVYDTVDPLRWPLEFPPRFSDEAPVVAGPRRWWAWVTRRAGRAYRRALAASRRRHVRKRTGRRGREDIFYTRFAARYVEELVATDKPVQRLARPREPRRVHDQGFPQQGSTEKALDGSTAGPRRGSPHRYGKEVVGRDQKKG